MSLAAPRFIAPFSSSVAEPNRTAHHVLLGTVLCYALAVRLLLVDMPFHSTSEGIGSYYGLLARNYFRYDFSTTLGVPVQSTGHDPAVPPSFYSHHPPLAPLMIAASYALFGQGDWQTRLPTALFTFGSTFLLYQMLRSRGRPRAGLFAAALFATCPFVLYYGNQPELINPQLVFFVLLATAAFFRFRDRPAWRTLAALCAAFALAGATDWPAFYLVPVAFVFFLFPFVRRSSPPSDGWNEGIESGPESAPSSVQSWKLNVGRRTFLFPHSLPLLFLFGLFSTTLFFALYAQITLAATHDWAWMIDLFAARSGGRHLTPGESFTFATWWAQAWEYNSYYHTLPVLLLAGAWVVTRAWRPRTRDAADGLTRFLLVFAFLHVLVGRQGCYAHAWWWWLLTPGLILAAALALDEVTNRLVPRVLPPRVGFAALLVGMLAFATWSHATMLPRLLSAEHTWEDGPHASRLLAAAARTAAPDSENDAVLIVSGDTHPTLWYYADRPLMMNAWSVNAFTERLAAPEADGPFGFPQPWPRPPVAAVFPKRFAEDAPELLEHLRATYHELPAAGRVAEHYWIFSLR